MTEVTLYQKIVANVGDMNTANIRCKILNNLARDFIPDHLL